MIARPMSVLTGYVVTYGLPLIFVIVLLEQLGAPIPAIPVLVVAGALSVDRDLSAWQVLVVAVGASLVADTRLVPARTLAGTADPEDPLPDLPFARLLRAADRVRLRALGHAVAARREVHPGILHGGASHGGGDPRGPRRVPPLRRRAARCSGRGPGWSAGMAFHGAIDRVLAFLASIGGAAFALLGAALVAFIAFKWWQRRRFYKVLRMSRISVDELRRLMDEGKSPIVLDVRTVRGRSVDPRRIQGAAVLDVANLDPQLRELPRDREIILYCT